LVSSASSNWVRDTAKKVPLAPFNGTVGRDGGARQFFRERDSTTFVRWNSFFTNPPLWHHRTQLRDRVSRSSDRGLWRFTDKR